jgi:hypothetical protein
MLKIEDYLPHGGMNPTHVTLRGRTDQTLSNGYATAQGWVDIEVANQ